MARTEPGQQEERPCLQATSASELRPIFLLSLLISCRSSGSVPIVSLARAAPHSLPASSALPTVPFNLPESGRAAPGSLFPASVPQAPAWEAHTPSSGFHLLSCFRSVLPRHSAPPTPDSEHFKSTGNQ